MGQVPMSPASIPMVIRMDAPIDSGGQVPPKPTGAPIVTAQPPVEAPTTLLPRLWMGALLVALVVSGTAWVLGATTVVVASTGAAAVVAASIGAIVVVRVVGRNYSDPLRLALQAFDALRRGDAGRRVPEQGAPIARALVRSLNLASAAIDARFRHSQASLMSVEVAFDRIHAVLQSLKEGVIVIDVAGQIVLANRVARRLLTDDGRPLEGRALVGLMTGDLADQIAAGLAQIAEGARERVQLMGLNAGERFYDIYIVPVESNRPDQDFGTVIVIADVTTNHEIARLKDQFLSSVSHELRTPLTNICAFSEILSQMGLASDGEGSEFVSIIVQESQRLKGLVEDLLNYTRIEMGQVEWNLQPVDVGEVAAAAVELFKAQTENSGVRFELRRSPEDCLFAMADREALNQVLARLIDNAVKFTPSDGTIRVTLARLPVGIEVAIEDSGKGVPLEHREMVFEKFSQLGDTLTDKPSGTGLGLPICRRIVDRLGGAIWCEDSDLGGAQFRFLLPAAMPVGGELALAAADGA